jgi:hypothetical protein
MTRCQRDLRRPGFCNPPGGFALAALVVLAVVLCLPAVRASAGPKDDLTRAKAIELILTEIQTGKLHIFNAEWVNPDNRVEVESLRTVTEGHVEAAVIVTTPPGVPDTQAYPLGGRTQDCSFSFELRDDSWRVTQFGGVRCALKPSRSDTPGTLDMGKVKSHISAGLQSQVGLEIVSVTCPNSREMKANDAFDCDAMPRIGGKLVVTVTQKDAEGNVDWSLEKIVGLLDMRIVEAEITKGLKAQAGVDATVSCGDRLRAARTGGTFECQARSQSHGNTPIVVTMTDAVGNINWAVK